MTSKSASSSVLLQKIFIITVIGAYTIDALVRLHNAPSIDRYFVFLLSICLVPIGFMLIAYATRARKGPLIQSVFTSLLAAMAAFVVWTTVVNLVALLRLSYRTGLVNYFATAALIGVIEAIILLLLRRKKAW